MSAHQISCPVLFHFGGADPYIPAEQAEQVRQAFAERGDVEVHVQEDAGHAFENSFSTQFSNPAATAESWPLTLSWLSRRLPASSASHWARRPGELPGGGGASPEHAVEEGERPRVGVQLVGELLHAVAFVG